MSDTTYYPPPQGYPYAPQQPPRKGVGITGLVLGIVALVLCLIPLIGILSVFLGAAAVIFGIIAVVSDRGKGQGIAGIVTGGVAFLVALGMTAITGAAISAFDEEVQESDRDFEEIQEAYESEAADAEPEDEEAIEEDDDEVAVEEGDSTFELGETAAIADSSTGDELYTITMNEITPDFQCTRDMGSLPIEAESGAFLGVDLSISAADDADGSFSVEDWDFYVVDSNGEITDFSFQGLDAYMCLANTDELQEVRPGTNSTGKIVFDTAVESGTLVYDGGPSEIQWEF